MTQDLLQGRPFSVRDHVHAVFLWLHYYVACDIVDGSKGPPPDWKRAESNAFSRYMLWLVTFNAQDAGISDDTWRHAQHEACDRSGGSTEDIDEFFRDAQRFLADVPAPATI